MSSNFAYRYVSITPEHTTSTGVRSYGTASGGANAKIFGEVDDESIMHNFDLMTRADMSRYGAAKSVNGKEFSEGGINLVIQADDFCGILFYGAYGDNAACNSANYTVSTNKHKMSEGLDHILPSFTIEVGREDNEHTYTGMCLSRLSVSGSVGEYATMSVDFSGKAESAISALATPTFAGATVEGLHFAEGTVSFSSDNSTVVASSNIKSISMEISTNLNTDDACSIGSRTYVRQPEPQMREITGSIEFSRPSIGNTPLGVADQDPQYEQITATGGREYDGTLTAPAITLFFTQSTTDVLKIKIPKVRWEAPSMNVSGRDSTTMSLNFVALVDDNMIMSETIFETLGSTVGRYSTL